MAQQYLEYPADAPQPLFLQGIATVVFTLVMLMVLVSWGLGVAKRALKEPLKPEELIPPYQPGGV